MDFSAFVAGPHCTRLLADLGAEVIKVESHVADVYRGGRPIRDGRDAARELIATADVVVEKFRPTADHVLPGVVGLLPALGGMYLLPKLVGLPRAKDMVLRAQAVSGRGALQIGLATELVDGERLRERAIELAAELAALPHRAYALAKEGLHQKLGSTIEREWPAAVAAQATLLASPDFQAAALTIARKQ